MAPRGRFSPTAATAPQQLLCRYDNPSDRMQIARITNIEGMHFERAVSPGQPLLFRAPRGARLELRSASAPTAIVADTIPCERLAIAQGPDTPATHAAGPQGKQPSPLATLRG